jgi:single-strand DNA-binding protein
MLNHIQIIGHLGQNPDTKYLPSGDTVCNFSVATTEKWVDKASGEKRDSTEWHRVAVFGRLAEVCGQYLKKGSLVYVSGKLTSQKYTDKDGIERVSYTIRANEMKMLGGKPEGQDRPREAQKPAQKSGDTNSFAELDDDIPF